MSNNHKDYYKLHITLPLSRQLVQYYDTHSAVRQFTPNPSPICVCDITRIKLACLLANQIQLISYKAHEETQFLTQYPFRPVTKYSKQVKLFPSC